MKLTGLAGTNGNDIECKFINKGKQIEAILNDGIAATSAGDNGAINIWKDDEGFIRCESMRFMISLEKAAFEKMPDAVKWANKWLKKIN